MVAFYVCHVQPKTSHYLKFYTLLPVFFRYYVIKGVMMMNTQNKKTIRHGYRLYPWRILLFLLILSLLYYNRFLSTPCGIVNLTINLLKASYSDIISLALSKSFDGLTCN